jgi:hypothetical protein
VILITSANPVITENRPTKLKIVKKNFSYVFFDEELGNLFKEEGVNERMRDEGSRMRNKKLLQ